MLDIDEYPSDAEITDAFTRGIREEVAAHHAAGQSVPGIRDGKIVWIPPPDAPDAPDAPVSHEALTCSQQITQTVWI